MRVGIDAHMIGDHSGGNESFYTNIINNMNPPKNMEIILFVKKGADLSALTNKFKRIEFQESNMFLYDRYSCDICILLYSGKKAEKERG